MKHLSLFFSIFLYLALSVSTAYGQTIRAGKYFNIVFNKDGTSTKVPTSDSGTFAPTTTGTINNMGVGSIAFPGIRWNRIGNVVHFSFSISTITVTTAGAIWTSFTIDLKNKGLPEPVNGNLILATGNCRINASPFEAAAVYVSGTATGTIDFFFNAQTATGMASGDTLFCPGFIGYYVIKEI